LNGDKKWLEEKFEALNDKMDYQFGNVNQELQKLWNMYEGEHKAHQECREEWLSQINFLKGSMKLNKDEHEAKDKLKEDHQRIEDIQWRRSERIWSWKMIIISFICSIITGIIVVFSRGIYPK
jgi:hypothetical protein